MNYYNEINSLFLDKMDYEETDRWGYTSSIKKVNLYLFYDIFCRNNELFLIAPIYSENCYHKYKKIKIFFDNKLLENNLFIWKPTISDGHCCILSYLLNRECINSFINITIKYENKSQDYKLYNLLLSENFYLTQTTLCQNDYKCFNIFESYYTKQGIEHYYLYYNGKIDKDIKDVCKKKNTTLIEWNFPYKVSTKCTFQAQHGQINHALYKYGKINSKYMLFNDLDELIVNENNDLLKKYIIDTNKLIYIFHNQWSISVNMDIPRSLPFKYNHIDNIMSYPQRSKCLYKTEIVDLLCVHNPILYYNEKLYISNKNVIRHFINWTDLSNNKENKVINRDNNDDSMKTIFSELKNNKNVSIFL